MENRRLWLGPFHQVATKVHAIRVGRPSVFAGIYSRILSKISGGRVTGAFRSGGFVILNHIYGEKEEWITYS